MLHSHLVTCTEFTSSVFTVFNSVKTKLNHSDSLSRQKQKKGRFKSWYKINLNTLEKKNISNNLAEAQHKSDKCTMCMNLIYGLWVIWSYIQYDLHFLTMLRFN